MSLLEQKGATQSSPCSKSSMAVGFTGLTIRCSIGILPHERQEPQEIVLSLKVRLKEPFVFHEIEVDYAVLAAMCGAIALQCHRDLLEMLASDIMQAITERFSLAHAWIRIEKPLAIPQCRGAFVELEKEFSL